jgi:glycosyltransferase involved in cell wall biosynthesis
LVILSPGFAANEADTTCLAPMQVFVKALKEVCPGLHVVVLAFQYPFVAAEYEWHGVEVIAIGGKSKGKLLRLRTWMEAWILLRKLNKEYQLLGLLNFWLGECAFVGSYFAKAHRLTQYTWLLGQDAKRGNKYFKWIKPQKDSLIALSDFIAREVRDNYGISPIQVIPLGIDTSLFSDALIKRDVDILGAGSLIPLKQYDVFVRAIAVVKESFPAVKAVICGKGPELERLQAMAKGLNLQDNLVFAGELPHAEVLDMMQRSKVFLHPSGYEGFGAVIAEALYAGAHVVSFVKPMDKAYRHQHVVGDEAEMHAEVLKILKTSRRGHDPVLMCPIQQTAKNMISLFVE